MDADVYIPIWYKYIFAVRISLTRSVKKSIRQMVLPKANSKRLGTTLQ